MSTKQQKMDYIASLINQCQKCSLSKTAKKAVPGAGNSESSVMIIAEAPGFYEDQSGIPFVGNCGKLVDQLLSSVNLTRDQVFISNILKHHPPQNRDPSSLEIKACAPFLKAQIKIIEPKIIMTLGRFALNYFFPNGKITQIHGQPQLIKWQEIELTVFPVYHPSAGLRDNQMLQALQGDFLKVKNFLN